MPVTKLLPLFLQFYLILMVLQLKLH
uniref:Uncharacterized protein n=1 Tax=Arundo donax TaxID=35708 RepID=A0A0A9BHC0_ARUDO